MPLKDVVKVSRKTFFNPSGWLGYDFVRSQVKLTLDIARAVFSPSVAGAARQETFADAMQRLQLTEADLTRIHHNYRVLMAVFLLLGVAVSGWGIWLLFKKHTFSGLVLGLAAAGLAFVNAFRYHFYAFQIRHRKLGCTFDEWLAGKTKEVKETKEEGGPDK